MDGGAWQATVIFTFTNKMVCMVKRKKRKEARMEGEIEGKKKRGKEKEEVRECEKEN